MPDSRHPVPSTERYVHALTVLEDDITLIQRLLLLKHWSFPGHAATATQLAHATGLNEYRAVNLRYGLLGKLLRQEMDYPLRDNEVQLDAIARLERPDEDGDGVLHMHPEVAAALEELGWVRSGVARKNSVKASAKPKKTKL